MIEHIKQIDGWQSLTAEQILDTLKAQDVTHHAVDLGELLFVMNERDMLTRLIRPADSGEKWAGTFANLMFLVQEHGTPEQAKPVNEFFSHITNDRNKVFSLHEIQRAAPFRAVVAMFADQPRMPTSADFDAIAQLGSGWKFAGLSVSDVKAAIAAEEQRIITSRLINAKAFFNERMTVDGDANEIWAKAWQDAEKVK